MPRSHLTSRLRPRWFTDIIMLLLVCQSTLTQATANHPALPYSTTMDARGHYVMTWEPGPTYVIIELQVSIGLRDYVISGNTLCVNRL